MPHPLNTSQYYLGGRDRDCSRAMESVHNSVGGERAASQQAPPMVVPEEMLEALDSEGDGMLGPSAAAIDCGHAGDSDSGR